MYWVTFWALVLGREASEARQSKPTDENQSLQMKWTKSFGSTTIGQSDEMNENDPRKIEDHKLLLIFLDSHNAAPKPLLRANEMTILFERGTIYCFTTSPENCSELHFFRLAEKNRQQIAWDPIKRKSSGAGGVINPTNRSSGQNWKLFLHNVRCGEKRKYLNCRHMLAPPTPNWTKRLISLSPPPILCHLCRACCEGDVKKIMPPVYSGIVQTRHCPKCQECHQLLPRHL